MKLCSAVVGAATGVLTVAWVYRLLRREVSSSSSSANTGSVSKLNNLKGFELARVLKFGESIHLLGRFKGQEGEAVILLRPSAHTVEELTDIMSVSGLQLVQQVQNTIYGYYDATLCSPLSPERFNVTVIHPAEPRHIAKYSQQTHVMMTESPEVYTHVTEPYINAHPASAIKWLFQLLERTAEQERLLFADLDPNLGFLMYAFRDVKEVKTWEKRSFSALAIVNRRDLRTLRDLDRGALPLLRNLRDKIEEFALTEFDIPADELRLFFHYKPTYFHLHLHVVHVNHPVIRSSPKDRFLRGVIGNLENFDEFYAKITMSYALGTKDQLYTKYQEWLNR